LERGRGQGAHAHHQKIHRPRIPQGHVDGRRASPLPPALASRTHLPRSRPTPPALDSDSATLLGAILGAIESLTCGPHMFTHVSDSVAPRMAPNSVTESQSGCPHFPSVTTSPACPHFPLVGSCSLPALLRPEAHDAPPLHPLFPGRAQKLPRGLLLHDEPTLGVTGVDHSLSSASAGRRPREQSNGGVRRSRGWRGGAPR
jgi:hypothetical protein